MQIAVAGKVFYAESIEKLIKNMNDCRPEIMTAVPRFYQNLFQKINVTFNYDRYIVNPVKTIIEKQEKFEADLDAATNSKISGTTSFGLSGAATLSELNQINSSIG